MIISKEKYEKLTSRIEIAENLITELPTEYQEDYVQSLNTWGLFSKKVHQSLVDIKRDRLDKLMGVGK